MEQIQLRSSGRIAYVKLDRPSTRNALSARMEAELRAAFQRLRYDDSVSAIVLEAEAPVFSSGHDLGEIADRDLRDLLKAELHTVELLEDIRRCPQPVIAKLRGPVLAGGLQLALSCDLLIAAEDVWFMTPGVKIGVFCSTPMVPLTRAIGSKRAFYMLATGHLVKAHTALEWGLVNQVEPEENLDSAVDELATHLASCSRMAMAMGKEAFYAQLSLDERQAYDLTRTVAAANATAADGREGIQAFLEKRSPTWSGR
ncbi:enoyl-CoA hydratase-related protein [Kribbella sp. NPDC050124]|uniref:enoyl-CoA hydratase-related protein n=1 Tax=Kribbella sp. NPDC050124 TaxID=3364114 RepID=UPI00378AA085